MRPAARQRRERAGRLAETAAALLLRLKGYRVLARRFTTPVGELDLVARRGDLVLFVEVKRRLSPATALESLLPRQQQHRPRRRLLSPAPAAARGLCRALRPDRRGALAAAAPRRRRLARAHGLSLTSSGPRGAGGGG